jgi:hypothetical protein
MASAQPKHENPILRSDPTDQTFQGKMIFMRRTSSQNRSLNWEHFSRTSTLDHGFKLELPCSFYQCFKIAERAARKSFLVQWRQLMLKSKPQLEQIICYRLLPDHHGLSMKLQEGDYICVLDATLHFVRRGIVLDTML